ncbi:hypothetical protein OEZ60_11780 [Defluviimonas sp. WL0024]|uniref:Uncharacterized protein n=1 Tax=Albidovulum salinarum TaxID=2984153 RepID=A0ABT2X403_9RHOB|nr:hypothetical protein [Defluviimonas sp. WL0024]MCU9848684.1 hypothetical protein [Defluviimonas sp. WL0024]
MVMWGSVEVPELEDRPIIGGDPKRWPAEPGTVHLATGMRMFGAPYNEPNRGDSDEEFLLYPPPGESWLLRVTAYVPWPGLRERVAKHLGVASLFELPVPVLRKAENEFLRTFGEEFVCSSVAPEPHSLPMRWTAERRDALVLLLFWCLEQSRVNHHDPYPSTLLFRPEGVPADLHGTFRNPIWERRQ